MSLPYRVALVGSFLFYSLPCLVQAQARPQTIPNGDNSLCWQQGRLLTWSDFRASECYGEGRSYASLVAATTAAGIPVIGFVDGAGRADYHVSCIFRRDSSWVNPRVTAAADRVHALAHEQVHFDTAELVARKIRCYVAGRRAADDDLFGPVVATEIQCLLDEQVVLGELYDDDVNFRPPAVEAAAQRRWAQQVARELRALAPYRSTAATCP